ncbi:MAG TPA: hypothetical protein VHN37_14135 [Actinomycetota bacterium]|nr:hypothetical protein [Actinomycetota bacterium]
MPDEPEVAWSLLGDDGSFHIIGVTHDPQSIEQVVVPDVEAGRYELVATWGPQEFRRSARQGVVVLSLVPAGTPVDATERDQPIAGGSRPASTAAPSRQARGPRSDESLGFRVVADPRVSLAIDAALLSLAAVVLWRSRWIRAVVVESVRHPRTPVTIERHGSDVVVRRAPGP